MTRKKPGPKPTGRARKVVSLRLAPDELDLVEQAAASKGLPMTEWMRDTLLRAARRTGR